MKTRLYKRVSITNSALSPCTSGPVGVVGMGHLLVSLVPMRE